VKLSDKSQWKFRNIMMLILCFVMVTCDSDLFKSKEVPVITDLSADLYEVDPGDTVHVSVAVENENGEALQYKWAADGGQFVPPVNQPQVLWIAPGDSGDYRLTVVVSNADGDSDPYSETIHVRDVEPPIILSLEFEAYVVDPGETVRISAILKEVEDATLDFQWTADGGQFLEHDNQSVVWWKAPAVGGEYQISLTVFNNQKQSAPQSGKVNVRSFAEPFVEITAPVQDEVFRQYDTIDIIANANHQNGIECVRLYLNEVEIDTLSGGNTEIYEFQCELSGTAGKNTIRVEAEANITGITGSDIIEIRVEGIVLGKEQVRRNRER